MEWMDQLNNILRQYTGVEAAQAPSTVHDDFDLFAQSAPQPLLADGLAEAFRSDQTPPFGQMIATLFGHSSGQQRAGILNTLISTLGPSIISQILARGGNSPLAHLLDRGQTQISPQEAQRVSPEAVRDLAAHAEQKDSSIIDTLSNFYAQHPTLVKSLGAAALTVALAKIAERQS